MATPNHPPHLLLALWTDNETGDLVFTNKQGEVFHFPRSESPHIAVMLAEHCDDNAERWHVRDCWSEMSTGERDCGHVCCDENSNPFHDHFLEPDECPACAYQRGDDDPHGAPLPDPSEMNIPCSGSGCPPAGISGRDVTGAAIGMCSCCGLNTVVTDDVIPDHDRLDIVAMVKRGDFDA